MSIPSGIYRVILAALLTLVLPASAAVQFDSTGPAEILERGIADHAFPGCTVVVGTDESVLWSDAFGFQDYTNHVRVTRDTIYDLASVTKVAGTTSVFMRLVALDKKTGQVIWWAHGDHAVKNTYHSTPVAAVIGGRRLILTAGSPWTLRLPAEGTEWDLSVLAPPEPDVVVLSDAETQEVERLRDPRALEFLERVRARYRPRVFESVPSIFGLSLGKPRWLPNDWLYTQPRVTVYEFRR